MPNLERVNCAIASGRVRKPKLPEIANRIDSEDSASQIVIRTFEIVGMHTETREIRDFGIWPKFHIRQCLISLREFTRNSTANREVPDLANQSISRDSVWNFRLGICKIGGIGLKITHSARFCSWSQIWHLICRLQITDVTPGGLPHFTNTFYRGPIYTPWSPRENASL